MISNLANKKPPETGTVVEGFESKSVALKRGTSGLLPLWDQTTRAGAGFGMFHVTHVFSVSLSRHLCDFHHKESPTGVFPAPRLFPSGFHRPQGFEESQHLRDGCCSSGTGGHRFKSCCPDHYTWT